MRKVILLGVEIANPIFLLTYVHELTICTFSITKSTVEAYAC